MDTKVVVPLLSIEDAVAARIAALAALEKERLAGEEEKIRLAELCKGEFLDAIRERIAREYRIDIDGCPMEIAYSHTEGNGPHYRLTLHIDADPLSDGTPTDATVSLKWALATADVIGNYTIEWVVRRHWIADPSDPDLDDDVTVTYHYSDFVAALMMAKKGYVA